MDWGCGFFTFHSPSLDPTCKVEFCYLGNLKVKNERRHWKKSFTLLRTFLLHHEKVKQDVKAS